MPTWTLAALIMALLYQTKQYKERKYVIVCTHPPSSTVLRPTVFILLRPTKHLRLASQTMCLGKCTFEENGHYLPEEAGTIS
jgi:hypothetical protein